MSPCRPSAAPEVRTRSRVRWSASSDLRIHGLWVADGPEIETDWFSFSSLNNPRTTRPVDAGHLYVDMKDENGSWLNLRPHTSPMQIRCAQAMPRATPVGDTMPEIRVIAPGRTYRVDSDATHSPMFHQVEGLWVGEKSFPSRT